jgi:hypothetical protein
MDADYADSEAKINDDNLRLPLTNTHTIQPNWWSHEYYEYIIKKHLGVNRLLTQNETLLIRLILCFGLFGIAIGYYSSVESWTLNDCIYFIAVSLSVSFECYHRINYLFQFFTLF